MYAQVEHMKDSYHLPSALVVMLFSLVFLPHYVTEEHFFRGWTVKQTVAVVQSHVEQDPLVTTSPRSHPSCFAPALLGLPPFCLSSLPAGKVIQLIQHRVVGMY